MRRVFVFTAGAILAVTGIAKVLSVFGSARLLEMADPILGLSFRRLMLTTSAVELAVAGVCFFSKSPKLSLILVALLATNLLAYRLALLSMDWHSPCSCLGNLTDALRIPPHTVATAMKIILAYLLIGSYACLFWLWWESKKREGRIGSEEARADLGAGS